MVSPTDRLRANFTATNHAVIRFIERVYEHDLTNLKIEYIVQFSLASIRTIEEPKFFFWVSKNIDLEPFRSDIIKYVMEHMDDNTANIIINQPRTTVRLIIDDTIFIIKDRKVITLFPSNQKFDESDFEDDPEPAAA